MQDDSLILWFVCADQFMWIFDYDTGVFIHIFFFIHIIADFLRNFQNKNIQMKFYAFFAICLLFKICAAIGIFGKKNKKLFALFKFEIW